MPATCQPSSANAAPVAAPIPPALPVTITVCTRTMLAAAPWSRLSSESASSGWWRSFAAYPIPTPCVDALARGGVGVIEITLDSDDALGTIARLRRRGDVSVIAGTVRRPEQVGPAVEAGARGVRLPGARARGR